MKTIKTLTTLSVVLLMTASIEPAFAVDDNMIQTQTHLKLHTSDADFSRSLNREQSVKEQNMMINKTQSQYQNKFMNSSSSEQGRLNVGTASSGSMTHQSTKTRSMSGGGRR